MALVVETYRTQAAVQQRSAELVARACGQGLPAVLVVNGSAQVEPRKLAFAHAGVAGVSVLTHAQWVEGLWDVFGTGASIVDARRRKLLLRPLLAEFTGREPSHGLLGEFSAFVEEAAALLAAGVAEDALSESERGLCALAQRYLGGLDTAGYVEPAVAERELAAMQAVQGAVVCEAPDARCAYARRFYELVAAGCEVIVLERDAGCLPQVGAGGSAGGDAGAGAGAQVLADAVAGAHAHSGVGANASGAAAAELDQLQDALFTGSGGVRAGGVVKAGEAHGAHVEGELLAQMLRGVLAQGTRAQDVAVVFASTADSYPRVQEALAHEGVPFECAFSLPLKRTAFGSAFIALARWALAPLEESTYEALAGFVATPYAGVAGRDARALHMRWRSRAHSTAQERLEDIRNGFVQGNADAKLVRERLAPLLELLEASWEERVRLMYAHALRAAGEACGRVMDDARAAQALLDYFTLCAQVGCEPQLQDLAELSVRLERAYAPQDCGEGARGVQLVTADQVQPGAYAHVVLANLDAAHHPMALTPTPFDALLAKLGVWGTAAGGAPQPDMPRTLQASAPSDAQANRERCLLLDCIGAAREGFSFYRVCHDAEGNESCQSALWDELMDAYRSESNAEVSPARLLEDAGCMLRVSEAGVFESGSSAVRSQQVVRGSLDDGQTRLLLAQYRSGDAIPFSPTALEDYYRCPYRWFASRRVGYNGMDNEFDQSAQGNLAHDFFNAFYRRLHKEGWLRVLPENLNLALALAEEVFDAQVRKGLGKPRTGLFLRTELDRLSVEDVRAQCLELIERDAAFLPGFAPAYFELELGKGTGSMLEYAGVPVRGKVDRIDVDSDGRAVVIDYKLSKLASGYGLEEGRSLPQRIQTDIYAALVQRHFELLGEDIEVVGSVYRSYSGNMLRGVYAAGLDWGPDEKSKPKADAVPGALNALEYADYLVAVERAVAECMERLGAGDIEPRPLADGTCEYCKALGFCPRGGA